MWACSDELHDWAWVENSIKFLLPAPFKNAVAFLLTTKRQTSQRIQRMAFHKIKSLSFQWGCIFSEVHLCDTISRSEEEMLSGDMQLAYTCSACTVKLEDGSFIHLLPKERQFLFLMRYDLCYCRVRSESMAKKVPKVTRENTWVTSLPFSFRISNIQLHFNRQMPLFTLKTQVSDYIGIIPAPSAFAVVFLVCLQGPPGPPGPMGSVGQPGAAVSVADTCSSVQRWGSHPQNSILRLNN